MLIIAVNCIIVYSYGSIGSEVMKKRGEKVHGLNDDQIRRLQDLKPHYNYGDYGTIAELTGNSRDYVRKVLDPNFPRWNETLFCSHDERRAFRN